MLKLSDTKQPDAVEKIVCQPLEKLKRYRMSDDIAEMLVKMMLYKEAFKNIPDDKEKPFIYKLIAKRIECCFTYKIEDPRLILFLAMISETPGKAVMYLAYLQYWCNKSGVQLLDLDTFCERIFPFVFPSDDDLHKLWDSQKVNRDSGGSDNLLDYGTAYQSIQFTELLWENLPTVEL